MRGSVLLAIIPAGSPKPVRRFATDVPSYNVTANSTTSWRSKIKSGIRMVTGAILETSRMQTLCLLHEARVPHARASVPVVGAGEDAPPPLSLVMSSTNNPRVPHLFSPSCVASRVSHKSVLRGTPRALPSATVPLESRKRAW